MNMSGLMVIQVRGWPSRTEKKTFNLSVSLSGRLSAFLSHFNISYGQFVLAFIWFTRRYEGIWFFNFSNLSLPSFITLKILNIILCPTLSIWLSFSNAFLLSVCPCFHLFYKEVWVKFKNQSQISQICTPLVFNRKKLCCSLSVILSVFLSLFSFGLRGDMGRILKSALYTSVCLSLSLSSCFMGILFLFWFTKRNVWSSKSVSKFSNLPLSLTKKIMTFLYVSLCLSILSLSLTLSPLQCYFMVSLSLFSFTRRCMSGILKSVQHFWNSIPTLPLIPRAACTFLFTDK